MRWLVLYTALMIGANPAWSGSIDWQAAQDGGLSRLVPGDPAPVPEIAFTDPQGGRHSLADYRGKVVLLNFWATWCAPCREEMPALDRLQAEMRGDDFEVVAIASGHNPPPAIDKFLTEAGVSHLPVLLDPRQELARAMGVMGMPVTVLIDREGQEIARLMGGADWSSDAALTLIRQAIAP
ncbi:MULTISPECIES: TlpA disulfide reductase family protein [unclassified Paracoccus (in: a-proteobacteria)]|uniref:TlpA disulfide reductase family protein n=1 Tax=unclassified Paracoccus (in: a-proteobacteria) TaxID=2688777 RepID=UPI0012B3E90C|nr:MULTISPECIES: TlpA disulfide reductase family protein [unclassified Paracoccus (in: a-proteobacteria)]UXU75063.1 TlpA family protein disulfide reductase [Paracoccus sp. SMMA_5]UXU80966.1 TlpA family protein disulfide reductase [Paracoccus sp. SMMA_5_TC]